jgi:hypothetical protein
METEVVRKEVREEVMRRMDAAAARAVAVDGLGAASESKRCGGGWKLETRYGCRAPALPLAMVSLAVVSLGLAMSLAVTSAVDSEACEGM